MKTINTETYSDLKYHKEKPIKQTYYGSKKKSFLKVRKTYHPIYKLEKAVSTKKRKAKFIEKTERVGSSSTLDSSINFLLPKKAIFIKEK